jgi:hypothetical protein
LIVAEAARSAPARPRERPALRLVSPTGGELARHAGELGLNAEPAEFVLGRINEGLDAIQEFAQCRDWADVIALQQRWAGRLQADYVSACALVTEAAIQVITPPAASPSGA